MKHNYAFWIKTSVVALSIAWTGCIVGETTSRPQSPPPPPAQPPMVQAAPPTQTAWLPGNATPVPSTTATPPTTATPATTAATPTCPPYMKWNGSMCVVDLPPGGRPPSICPANTVFNGVACVATTPTTTSTANPPATSLGGTYTAPPGARPSVACPPGYHVNGATCVPN